MDCRVALATTKAVVDCRAALSMSRFKVRVRYRAGFRRLAMTRGIRHFPVGNWGHIPMALP